MPHDQLWKDVLLSFFAEFMELFFPQAAERLDFNRITQVNKELFTDIPDGARREPDLLLEVYTNGGDLQIILVHIEVQAKRKLDVPYRMWEYFSLLRLRLKLPVFPVVVYLTKGAGGIVVEEYQESLFGVDNLMFRYNAIGLPDLKAEDYLEKENILALALSALMRGERAKRVSRKLQALDRVVKAGVDEARRSLLINVVDRYLELSAEEELEFNRLTEGLKLQEVKEYLTSWEKRGIKKGIGQGIIQGKRETLLRLLRHRFGELPGEVIARIGRIESPTELDSLADKLLDARSLAEMGLPTD